MGFGAGGNPIDISRPLRAKYTYIEPDILRFLRFVRSKRLPVTMSLTPTSALMESEIHQILLFKTSLGWIS